MLNYCLVKVAARILPLGKKPSHLLPLLHNPLKHPFYCENSLSIASSCNKASLCCCRSSLSIACFSKDLHWCINSLWLKMFSKYSFLYRCSLLLFTASCCKWLHSVANLSCSNALRWWLSQCIAPLPTLPKPLLCSPDSWSAFILSGASEI